MTQDSNNAFRLTFMNIDGTEKLRSYIISSKGIASSDHRTDTKWLGCTNNYTWIDIIGRAFQYDGSIHSTNHEDPENPVLITSINDTEQTRCEGSIELATLNSKSVAGIIITEKSDAADTHRIYNRGMVKTEYPIHLNDRRIEIAYSGDCLIQITINPGDATSQVIEIGDLICCYLEGVCMRQSDDIIRSKTIAKSMVYIDLNNTTVTPIIYTLNSIPHTIYKIPCHLLL